jgi:penicillin V acylase-like amidase (Ntn superfamily)
MRKKNTLIGNLSCIVLTFILLIPQQVSACSTFKLQKGDSLIYGHNLDEDDVVPGLIFINKRGLFKLGRTWSELTTKERLNPSSHCWISRYGSVTFNVFGRDLPDGGMNEVGLYIWEMSVYAADYPKNGSLPKLNQMHWMQYILDNYSTVEEAIQCASEIEIDGWSWHFFVGDAKGNTAAISFIDGEVVVNKGEDMPVPGLFNLPYNRELEYLRYYKGFGGLYEPDLSDFRVPRFVKTAVMIRDYKPTQNIVGYSFGILDALKAPDIPEWSVVFDVRKRNVYFKTRINPEIKSFSMDKIDFSNNSPVLILNMDIKNGGDVLNKFHPYTNEEMREFIKKLTFLRSITSRGITLDEYSERASTHGDAAALADNQYFKGVWRNKPDKAKDEIQITIRFETKADAVFGRISLSEDAEEFYKLDHIHLIGNNLRFTFETNGERNKFLEVQASIDDETMNVNLYGIFDYFGNFLLLRDDQY